MATKKGPVLDGDAIARAIANDLPGWTQARPKYDDAAAEETIANAAPGATINDLRKKFLGADADAAGADAGPVDYGSLASDRATIQVEPKSGGPAKVADVVGGKVKIVQG